MLSYLVLTMGLDPETFNYSGFLAMLLPILGIGCATLAVMVCRDMRKKRATLKIKD